MPCPQSSDHPRAIGLRVRRLRAQRAARATRPRRAASRAPRARAAVLTRAVRSCAVTFLLAVTWLLCPPSASASSATPLLAERDIVARHSRLSSVLSGVGVPCEAVDSRFNGFVPTAESRPETRATMWSVECSGIGWFSVVIAGGTRDAARVVGYCGPETIEWWGSLPCLGPIVIIIPRDASSLRVVPTEPRWPDNLVLPAPRVRRPPGANHPPPRSRAGEPRRPSQIQQGVPQPLTPLPR